MKSLKEIRHEIGLKQYEAAKLLGITKDYLYMLEKGKRKPSHGLIEKMSVVYKIAPEIIFMSCNRTICTKDGRFEPGIST